MKQIRTIRQPNQDAIDVAEELLQLVRDGDVTAFAVAFAGVSTSHAWAGLETVPDSRLVGEAYLMVSNLSRLMDIE